MSERRNAQRACPRAQLIGAELLEQWSDAIASFPVAFQKRLAGLRVREIEPALAGEQEFAADRGHRVVQVDLYRIVSS